MELWVLIGITEYECAAHDESWMVCYPNSQHSNLSGIQRNEGFDLERVR